MICKPEQFLLVLQKWITDSASVSFVLLILVNDDTAIPALSVTLRGRVLAIDPARNIMFSSTDGGTVIHVDNWTEILYLDRSDLPRIGSIKEGFRLKKQGASTDLLIE